MLLREGRLQVAHSGVSRLVAGFAFRVPSLGFQVSGFGFRVSGFGVRVSGSGFRVWGLVFRVSPRFAPRHPPPVPRALRSDSVCGGHDSRWTRAFRLTHTRSARLLDKTLKSPKCLLVCVHLKPLLDLRLDPRPARRASLDLMQGSGLTNLDGRLRL